MDKEIKLLEGQSGILKAYPTFEGKPIIKNIKIDTNATDMKGMVSMGEYVPENDGKTVSIPVTAKAISEGTGKLVFRYMGTNSSAENIGTSTKNIGIVIAPAQLKLSVVNPSSIKWVPGGEVDIKITWLNGTETLLTTDPALTLTPAGDEFTILSRTEDGIRIKMNPSGKANVAPTKEQSITAKFYSGSVKTVLNFYVKPELKITPKPPAATPKGSTHPFPFKIMDGTKDTSGLVKNIKGVSDPYVTFNSDGSFTIVKVELLVIIRTLKYTFDYQVNELTWNYSAQVNVNIGALLNINIGN